MSDCMSRQDLVKALISYTCTQNCFGVQNNHGGCCTLDERDFIIGPMENPKQFLKDLSLQFNRPVKYQEVFIDFKEGRKLFPDRSAWQDKRNYPALRVLPEAPHPCRFYDADNRLCTVYSIRPENCREYLCQHLDDLLQRI